MHRFIAICFAASWSMLSLAQSVTLPFDQVDTLDGVKYKIRVPANWNGTLLLYMQASKTAAAPAEPAIAPPVISNTAPLDSTLLARGYALAASEVSTSDWQFKEEVQDTFALANYFRGKVGAPKRVILWGSSLGGYAALRMMEDYPRSFHGALAMCAPSAGASRRMDRNLDFALAYEAVFGWPAEWGPVGSVKDGISFANDVVPRMKMPASDESNKGSWEFIRLIFGLPPDAFYGVCPLYKMAMYMMVMATATEMRDGYERWATGPVSQNTDFTYTLKPEDKAYLSGLDVSVDQLLSKLNARKKIETAPAARDFVVRFGDLRGVLKRPVITMKNTMDGQCDTRHEAAYRAAVEVTNSAKNLMQVYVGGVGHCAFTANQILASLAALESWLDTGIKPEDSSFPAFEGFDRNYVPPSWPASVLP